MLLTALIAFAAYVAGCFSHKWAAKAFYDGTGVTAQSAADAVQKNLKG